MIKPRDTHGKIITNISDKQFIAGVKNELSKINLHNWECWNCGTIYDAEPEPNKIEHCPKCNAEPVPF